MVDLKSPGSMPNFKEKLETSEQVLMADSFRCRSVDNLREVLRNFGASMLK
jgi:hypothetical protein